MPTATYFLRCDPKDDPPDISAHSAVIVPEWVLRADDPWPEFWQLARSMDIEIGVHFGSCYLDPDHHGWMDGMRDRITELDGWLKDPLGRQMKDGAAWVIDMRRCARTVASYISEYIVGQKLPFDILYLDSVFDDLPHWNAAACPAGGNPWWKHATLEERKAAGAAWRRGMAHLAMYLRFFIGKSGMRVPTMYGNGFHSIAGRGGAQLYAGMCYEQWPHTMWGLDPQGLESMLTGKYGAIAHNRTFKNYAPMLLPHGEDNPDGSRPRPGEGVPADRIVQAVAFAAAFAPDAYILVNNGVVADVIEEAQ